MNKFIEQIFFFFFLYPTFPFVPVYPLIQSSLSALAKFIYMFLSALFCHMLLEIIMYANLIM